MLWLTYLHASAYMLFIQNKKFKTRNKFCCISCFTFRFPLLACLHYWLFCIVGILILFLWSFILFFSFVYSSYWLNIPCLNAIVDIKYPINVVALTWLTADLSDVFNISGYKFVTLLRSEILVVEWDWRWLMFQILNSFRYLSISWEGSEIQTDIWSGYLIPIRYLSQKLKYKWMFYGSLRTTLLQMFDTWNWRYFNN